MAFMSATTKHNAKVISLIGTGHGMSHFYSLALVPLIPLIKAEFGVSYAAIGFLFTILNITGAAVQIPVGFLVDRIGGRILLPLGLGMMAFPFLAFGYADNYQFALILMAIAGIGSSVFHPVDYAILNATIEEKYLGRAFSLHTLSGNIGIMIAPGLMILFSSLWDWRTALVISGGIGVAFMALMIANGHLLHGKKVSTEEHLETAASTKPTAATMSGIKVLLLPQVLLMFLFYIFITGMTTGVITFSATILGKINGIELVMASTILTCFLAANGVGLVTGGIIADKWKRHSTLAVTVLFLTAVLLVIIGGIKLPLFLIILAFILMGFFQAMIRPTRDMIVRAIIPRDSMGKVFGFLSTAMSVGHAITPVCIGWLIDQGHTDIVFYLLAGLMLLAIPTLTLAQSPAVIRGTYLGTETAAGKAAAE